MGKDPEAYSKAHNKGINAHNILVFCSATLAILPKVP